MVVAGTPQSCPGVFRALNTMMVPHRKGYTLIEALPLVILALKTLASAKEMVFILP